MTLIQKLNIYGSFAVLVGATGLIVLAVWWVAFDANPPVVFDSPVVQTDREQYRAGDEVYITSNFCLRTAINPIVNRIMVEQNGGHSYLIRVNAPGVGLAVGCHSRRFAIATITPQIAPGKYAVIHTSRYELNPLATREVSFRTSVFEVLP